MARAKKTFEVPKKQNDERMYMLIPHPFDHHAALKWRKKSMICCFFRNNQLNLQHRYRKPI